MRAPTSGSSRASITAGAELTPQLRRDALPLRRRRRPLQLGDECVGGSGHCADASAEGSRAGLINKCTLNAIDEKMLQRIGNGKVLIVESQVR